MNKHNKRAWINAADAAAAVATTEGLPSDLAIDFPAAYFLQSCLTNQEPEFQRWWKPAALLLVEDGDRNQNPSGRLWLAPQPTEPRGGCIPSNTSHQAAASQTGTIRFTQ